MMSIVNRAIYLNRGFITLANASNYQSAIPLMRLQVDNCLRLFAMSLHGNDQEFYEKILQGEKVRNLKDRDNKKMTDAYLVTKINEYYPLFKSIYEKLSGHIHFSSEHFQFNNIVKNNVYSITVGAEEKLEIYKKVDFTYNMFQISITLLEIVAEYRKEITK